jgi:YD repeat-containing protein
MDWDTKHVEQVRWELLNRRTRRVLQAACRRGKPVPVFLIIDDSLVEKSGRQMEGVEYHYSHSMGRTALGHVWVTGHLAVLSYDDNGNLAEVRDPISRTVAYGYDQSGNLATVTDTRGYTWTYTYTGTHLLQDVLDDI